MNEEDYMMGSWTYTNYTSSTDSTSGYWMKPQKVSLRDVIEEVSKEQEEDIEKHLPIFDPKDLDI